MDDDLGVSPWIGNRKYAAMCFFGFPILHLLKCASFRVSNHATRCSVAGAMAMTFLLMCHQIITSQELLGELQVPSDLRI